MLESLRIRWIKTSSWQKVCAQILQLPACRAKVFLKGYKEYDTKRKYLVQLGDWRNNKDEEVELDGIGGVNILVKADVHRSGEYLGRSVVGCRPR